MARITDELTYMDRSYGYYINEMYIKNGELGKAVNITKDVFDGISPNFNAVPKIINTVSDLTVGSDIKIINDSSGLITDTFVRNEFKTNKQKYITNLILGKSLLFEAILSEETKEVEWLMHDANRYEVVKQGREIIYAKIVGDIYKFNPDDEVFETQKATKTYINNEGVMTVKTVTEDGEELESKPIVTDRLPLVELVTEYDMTRLFYAIDQFNNLDAYEDGIFRFAAEPILSASGVRALSEESKSSIGKDTYKKKKVLMSGYDTELKYLEIKGTSVAMMTEKQDKIKEGISEDFPEYSMHKIVSGSNISTETVIIRLQELLSRVQPIRSAFKSAILDLLDVTAMLKGTTLEGTIELGEPITSNSATDLQLCNIALPLGIMSNRSAMTLISRLYMDEDVTKEIERINEEGNFEIPPLDGITTNTELGTGETKIEIKSLKNQPGEITAGTDKTNNAIKE